MPNGRKRLPCGWLWEPTRRRLLRQFVTESLLLAGIVAAPAGMLLALAGTHFLLRLFPSDVANLNIPKVSNIPI